MSELEQIKKSKRSWGIGAAICGAAFAVSFLAGLLGTVIGMVGAFNVLEKSGEADPAELANQISFAMLTTLWGSLFAGAALICAIIALVVFLVKGKRLKAFDGSPQ